MSQDGGILWKGLVGQQAGQEAVMCPGNKGDQQHPGLYDQGHSQEIEGGDYLGYCIQISDPQYRKNVSKMERV